MIVLELCALKPGASMDQVQSFFEPQNTRMFESSAKGTRMLSILINVYKIVSILSLL